MQCQEKKEKRAVSMLAHPGCGISSLEGMSIFLTEIVKGRGLCLTSFIGCDKRMR
jgi:hypothetical protein